MMKYRIPALFSLLITLFFSTAHAEEELLEPDKAFAFSASTIDSDTLRVEWKIADGYYLYRNKLRLVSDTPGIELGALSLPDGKRKQDEFFGEVEIYRNKVVAEVKITARDPAAPQIKLVAHSQGCADIGVCYPPHKQMASLDLPGSGSSGGNTVSSALNSLSNSLGLGAQQDEVLDPDVAFRLHTELADANTIVASWQITPDHYLYRDKFKFKVTAGEAKVAGVSMPAGDEKHDEFFGKIRVFHEDMEARIPLARSNKDAGPLTLELTYQGCAEKTGICYPPIKKSVNFDLPVTTSLLAVQNTATPPVAPARNNPAGDGFSNMFKDVSLFMVVLAALGSGLLLAFTACMYPMIPILSSIIVGQGEKVTVGKAFGLSLLYVQSMAITFAIIGALVGGLSDAIGIQAMFQKPVFLIPFALLFVLLAISMFGFFNLQIPAGLQSKLSAISNKQEGGTLIGVVIMGVLSALIIGPCGGPILIAALTYATTAGSVKGALAMFALGNGMGLPLLLVGTIGGKLLPRAGDWMNVVKAVAGVILIAVAIVFLSRMPDIFSPMIIMFMWATLFIISAIYLGALEPLSIESTGWKKLWKGMGIIFLVYGVFILLGGLTGGKDVTNPLHGSKLIYGTAFAATADGNTGTAHAKLKFQRIKTVADLEAAIADAKQQNKPVMLDFYADWCTYCIQYEEYVFPETKVRQSLSDFVLLQADVTDIDELDKALMKHVGVLLPPAILFFDATTGKEERNFRIVGSMSADQFLTHVNNFKS